MLWIPAFAGMTVLASPLWHGQDPLWHGLPTVPAAPDRRSPKEINWSWGELETSGREHGAVGRPRHNRVRTRLQIIGHVTARPTPPVPMANYSPHRWGGRAGEGYPGFFKTTRLRPCFLAS